MAGRESDGLVIEVIEGDTTAVFVAVTAIEDEPTGVFVARTRTETWRPRELQRIRRRR